MAEPFLAEIRAFCFTFAPQGWISCQGQLLPISQNTALFSLIGTFYGGDGRTTFGLPDLRGRVAIHQGNNQGLVYDVGQSAGSEATSVLVSNMPGHSHSLGAIEGAAAATQNPQNAVLAAPMRNGPAMYAASAPNVAMAPGSIGTAGNGTPFSTLMPTLVLNYCIAAQGIFPARN